MEALPNFENLTYEKIREEFLNERQRCEILEKDLFKSQTHCRRLETQIK